MARGFAIIGMIASGVWIVALIAEYQLGLQPPGDGTLAYRADQAAFAVAQLGYLLLVIGLFTSRAGGDGRLGRVGIAIWAIAVGALATGQVLSLFGPVDLPLAPIGGLGQIIGSILTAVAVWQARRWTGWRRLAPAIWAAYTLVLFVAIAAALPGLTIPAADLSGASPSEPAEAIWQIAWFIVALALYLESVRRSNSAVASR